MMIRIIEDFEHEDGWLFWKGEEFDALSDGDVEVEVKVHGEYVSIPSKVTERL